MRVLVTGAAGFIGSEVTRAVSSAGHRVTAVSRAATTSPRLRDLDPAVLVLDADLEDAAEIERVLAIARPDAVVHLAWYANPADYLTARANLGSLSMTIALADAALQAGCRRLVAAGTCLEYAPSGVLRREGDAEDPRSLYASCKLAARYVLRARAEAAGAALSWGRVFHLHGPGEAPERVIPWVAAELRRGRPVDLTDGAQLRDHLHVRDVAAGFLCLLEKGEAGVTNICSGEPVSLRAVLTLVGDLVGRPEGLRFGARPRREDEIPFLAGDSSRLRALGWRPTFGLAEGLADALGRGAAVSGSPT